MTARHILRLRGVFLCLLHAGLRPFDQPGDQERFTLHAVHVESKSRLVQTGKRHEAFLTSDDQVRDQWPQKVLLKLPSVAPPRLVKERKVEVFQSVNETERGRPKVSVPSRSQRQRQYTVHEKIL